MSSIGQINLDLKLNSKSFKKELNSVQSQAQKAGGNISSGLKKIGTAVVAAFSVKKIVDFGKQCISLGSDLSEVQNVVDVTFGSMSAKVDEFAKNAATSYGLSETMAKKYTGLYGSMASAFGFSEKEAFDMSTALTGLAGDVASFYNISQDEAYTKLKSVFSGETETLKDLGVVMTQSALDSYALANGFGKTTAQMTEAEKVSLRYAFVQKQLSNAQGDFSRTSDSWANQVRVLKLRFDSLKATLGQAFIQILTPVIKVLNTIIEKISIAAQKFADFISGIFGKDTSSSMGNTASELADASVGLEDSSSSVSDNMNEANKATEKIKNNLAGFDKINVIGNASSSDGDSGSSKSSSGPNLSTATAKGMQDTAKKTESAFGNMFKNLFKGLYEKSGAKDFVEKIKDGIKEVNWNNIGDNFKTIFKESIPIAETAFENAKQVGKAAFGAIGSFAGAAIKVSGKSLETISGGVSKWITKDSGLIQGFINTCGKNIESGLKHVSNVYDSLGNIIGDSIDRMRGRMEDAISDLLGGLTDFTGNISVVFTGAYDTAMGALDEWLKHDSEEIGLFFDNLQTISADLLETFGTIFSDIGTVIGEWWNGENGQSAFQSVCDMFTNIGTTFMNIFNDWIMPVWNFIKDIVMNAWNNALKPVFEKVLNFFGKVGEAVSTVWNNFLSPIVNWIVDVLGPVFTNVFNAIGGVFSTVFGIIGDVIGGIIDALGGLLDFITGIFSGDWEKAWNGIKSFFKGIWDGIWGIIKGVVNLIIDAINLLWTAIYTAIAGIVNGLGSIVSGIGDLLGLDWGWEIPTNPPLIPKLATGGIIKAPTLAVVGDNAGASSGNPEVVSPLNQLQSLLDTSSNGKDVAILSQILDYIKRLYEMFLVFKNNGGSTYEFIAELEGNTLFIEMIKQNELYKKRHNGVSAFA